MYLESNTEFSLHNTQTTKASNNAGNNSCCITPSFILVALGVITLVGAAIAAWQLYSSLGNLSFVCLIATPLAIALIVYGILKSGIKDPNITNQSEQQQQVISKLPPWKIVKEVETYGELEKTSFPVKLIKMENEIEGFSGKLAIIYGDNNAEDILFFEKDGKRCLLPDDGEIPTSIIFEGPNLLLKYSSDERETLYYCHLSHFVEGPNGLNFTPATLSVS